MIKIKVEFTISQSAMLLSAIDNRLRDIEAYMSICRQRVCFVPHKDALEFEKSELCSARATIKNAIPIEDL